MIDPNLKIVQRDPKKLKAYAANARVHPPAQIAQIRNSIRTFGFYSPILLKDDEATIGVGHGRNDAAILEGLKRVPTITLRGLTEAEWMALVIADNRLAEGATWDYDLLRSELGQLAELGFDLSVTGFSLESLGSGGGNDAAGALLERFGIAPFSVLNAREGWWQDRKRAWIALGIRSEVGRGENLLKMSDTVLEPDPIKRKALETASLKGGLTHGTTMHPYDDTGAKRNTKAAARAFGQDILLGEARLQPARGVTRRGEVTPPGSLYRPGTPARDPGFYEKKRKAEAALGREIDLEEFRANFYDRPTEASGSGTSIFDPVLAELAYRWFSPLAGVVLDPFAGGSVRGIVAAKLGRLYVGIDLRQEQVDANRVQAAMILGEGDGQADWIVGDSADLLGATALARGEEHVGPVDFIFSCPPYFDLEKYSDDPLDLSTMEWGSFLQAYRSIIFEACSHLKPHRFAAFVVGDIRDPAGGYRGFVRETELAFEAAGCRLYNHAILVTAAGSLAMRAGRAFEQSRKLGKTHQDILVFVKGDPVKAAAAIGKPEFGEIGAGESEEPDASANMQMHTGSVPSKDGMRSEPTPFGEKLLSLGGEVE